METCLLYSVGGEAQFCIGRVTTPALLVPFTFSWIQLIIMDFSGASKDATSLQRIATIQGFAKVSCYTCVPCTVPLCLYLDIHSERRTNTHKVPVGHLLLT